jgi:hypothetical protein
MKNERPAYSRLALTAIAVYIFASYCILLFGRDTIDWLIEEDSVVEWIGTVGLFVAAGCFLWAFVISSRGPLKGRFIIWKRLALLALAVLLFVAAGEEISWGQRLLGISTPEGLGSVSTQNETNLHNIDFFQNSISVDRLFQLFWIGFAVAVPVLSRLWDPARRLFDRFLPIFPLGIALLFVFNQLVQTVFEWFIDRNDDLYHSTYAVGAAGIEILESNVGLLLGLGALAVLRSFRREQAETAGTPDGERQAALSG